MSELLPSGTLTVLHTDIESSTRLTAHLGERYPEVLAAHCRLLRGAFAANEGREVDTQGDSFFVVFPRATQAVAAAVTSQRALAAERWPEGGPVRVRIGLHTGEPIRTAQGYTGLDVIRGARIKEAGHGGQVLLSKSTAALIEDALIGGLSLRDLGPHRLKGLPHPERIFQLIIPDLPADFPPLQSLDVRGLPRPGVAPRRVLTTVFFVDMVGATEKLLALGDRRWLEVWAKYIALIRQELARRGGEEVNTVGDQTLAIFDGAVAAIHCGCAIRDAVHGLGMAVRVGIHAGEVEYDDTTMSGITVFTGNRIMAVAQPGEVLVSSTVKELVAGSGITFNDRGYPHPQTAPRRVAALRARRGRGELFHAMTSLLKPQKRAGIQPGTATVPLSRMIPPPDEVRASTMPFDPRAPFLAFGSVRRSRVNAGVSPIGLMSSP